MNKSKKQLRFKLIELVSEHNAEISVRKRGADTSDLMKIMTDKLWKYIKKNYGSPAKEIK